MQKIVPFLWFRDQAEEAARFYTSVFPDAEVLSTLRYGEEGPGTPGSVMAIRLKLAGQEFDLLNGDADFSFNPSISFTITCESQEEVDYYWDKLLDGGSPLACGWLTDRFGVSWQVTPRGLMEMIADPDKEKAGRVMRAMLAMIKLDLQALRDAYEG